MIGPVFPGREMSEWCVVSCSFTCAGEYATDAPSAISVGFDQESLRLKIGTTQTLKEILRQSARPEQAELCRICGKF
jgi:hypothetical protein